MIRRMLLGVVVWRLRISLMMWDIKVMVIRVIFRRRRVRGGGMGMRFKGSEDC